MKTNKEFMKIITGIILVIVSVSFLTLASSSLSTTDSTTALPTQMYLTLEGETQGDILGSVTQAGHEGQIHCIGYQHTIVSPRDAASGLPTGKRQHKPFVITKEVDKSTPLLYYSLTNNENMANFKMEFISDSISFYRIELVDAQIVSIHSELRPDINVEVISFVYSRIIWTWVQEGITAEDDWEAPTT